MTNDMMSRMSQSSPADRQRVSLQWVPCREIFVQVNRRSQYSDVWRLPCFVLGLVGVPVAVHAGEATAPLCIQSITEVDCFKNNEIQVLQTGPMTCEADENHDDCCWLTGESLRLQCAFTVQGQVLETRCLCAQAIPVASTWGLAMFALFILAASTIRLRERIRPTPAGTDR